MLDVTIYEYLRNRDQVRTSLGEEEGKNQKVQWY